MNQESLPGASTALTMGIISVVGALVCCGPFAAIFSIIGLNNAKTARLANEESPGQYSGIESANTGRILSYVGLALSVIMLIFLILYFGVIMALVASGEFQEDW